MPTTPSRKSSAARKTAVKKRAVKKRAPSKRTAAQDGPPVGQGAVLKTGMDQVALTAPASRIKVGNELGLTGTAKKSLLDVARDLKIVGAKNNEEARILARLAGTAQEDALRTAILDALNAKREIKYFCGIEDPTLVDDIHCHIHVDQDTTVVEFVPGQVH